MYVYKHTHTHTRTHTHTHTHIHTHLLAVAGQGPRLAEKVFDRFGVADPLLIGLSVEVRGLVLFHFSLALLSLFDLDVGSIELEPADRHPQGRGPI